MKNAFGYAGAALVSCALLWAVRPGKAETADYLYVSVQLPASARLEYREGNCWLEGPAPGWLAMEPGVYAWREALPTGAQPRPLFDRVRMPAGAAGTVKVQIERVRARLGQTPEECRQALRK